MRKNSRSSWAVSGFHLYLHMEPVTRGQRCHDVGARVAVATGLGLVATESLPEQAVWDSSDENRTQPRKDTFHSCRVCGISPGLSSPPVTCCPKAAAGSRSRICIPCVSLQNFRINVPALCSFLPGSGGPQDLMLQGQEELTACLFSH